MKLFSTLLLFIFFLPALSFSQKVITIENYYKKSNSEINYQSEKQVIKTKERFTIKIDLSKLKKNLVKSKHRSIDNFGSDVLIKLPNPDGGSSLFRVLANTTMHPDYQQKFQGIRTFDVSMVDNPSVNGKIDFTHAGFHAMIFSAEKGNYYIDPIYLGNDTEHMVYYKKDFYTDKEMSCEFEGNPKYKDISNDNTDKSFGTCELKTYRLALSATGEYTVYHGGDVADAASAQVTTMNRVNGVYERDMAITMTIIANNDTLIYEDASTDPFTNGSPGSMIGQNQTLCTNVIGSANYDIGHVFGTNSGGLAGLGVVCSSFSKARGVTGSSGPIGDAFDIDYVAHEMGHQFGCNHSFNNLCGGNRNNSTAMEPGSGSTIMAYAGICTPNVQSNSDDHFHGISLEEMGNFTTGSGGTCPVVTPLINSAPEITSTNGDIYIPISTPFALTAFVSDVDGDSLLYCWEQMDKEISTQPPVSSSTVGPNFRSNSPDYSPTRYFPNLASLAAGSSPTWEVLPSVTRLFNFRVVVRDNASGGGCNDHADVTVNSVASAGPFVLNYPTESGISWSGYSSKTLLWNVANTNLYPINCEYVDVFLSTDGGLTYPLQIADDIANDGSHTISVPNIASTQCRIMLMSQNGSFFDISNNNFEITIVTYDFTLNTTESIQSVCPPDAAIYTIDVGSIGGYSDDVALSVSGLPAGANAVFLSDTLAPPASTTLTISGSSSVIAASYELDVEGISTSGNKNLVFTYEVLASSLDTASLIFPADAATGVSIPVNFAWSDAGYGAFYNLEVATDIGFTNIILNQVGLESNGFSFNGMENATTYYWRVSAYNSCTVASLSEVYSFTTVSCSVISSTDVPKIISSSGTPTVTSTLEVLGSGTVLGLSVVDLTGQHSWINDITITLTSPEGTTVTLFSAVCNNENDWDLNFDDNASSGTLPCPPIGGGTYIPQDAFSAFFGEDANGTWTLSVSDSFNADGGSLDSWGIDFCLGECIEADIPVLIASADSVCSGNPVELSVESGNLNDASDWFWYSTSCSGTQLGSGSSIVVYPEENSTYYANGGGGCTNSSLCGEVDVAIYSVSVVSDSAIICQGESYTFPDGSIGTSSTIQTSVIPDFRGCDSIVVTTLDVINLNSTIILNNGVLSSNQSSSNATYQWIDCNNNDEAIEGEIFQTFTPTQNGSYAVVLTSTSELDCQETSICKEVIGVGIEENTANNFNVFPNPSSGIFKLNFDSMNSYDNVEITDYRGRLVFSKELKGELELEFDLSNESDGVYILKLKNSKGVKVVKLIKK